MSRVGVVTFPGSLDDRDALRAVRLAGGEAVPLWHADRWLAGVDAVILPGGFSYGDYLRAGAIARFSPVMAAVVAAAGSGLPVLGVCNGFQILCESGLLPGALLRNEALHFVCREVHVDLLNTDTAWTNVFPAGSRLRLPVKNGEGRYVADPATLDMLESTGRVVFRYAAGDNPSGAVRDIAGICNEAGNVVGLMPHPEHAVEPLTGVGSDGLGLFQSVLKQLVDA
jgi:phosphoribosylformylglycinamidine synthase